MRDRTDVQETRISALERAAALAATQSARQSSWVLTGALFASSVGGSPALGAVLEIEALLPMSGLVFGLQPFGGLRGVLWNPSSSISTFPGQALTYDRKDEFVELEAGVKRYAEIGLHVYGLAAIGGVVQPEGKRRLGFSGQFGGGVLLYPGRSRIGLEARLLVYRTASREIQFNPFGDSVERYLYRWNLGIGVGVVGSFGVL